MRKYSEYKESGVQWMGEVPKHWDVKRLGSYFTENRTLNTDLSCTEAYKFNLGSLVRKDEGVDLSLVEDTYAKYTVLTPNDIVINGLNLNYDFVSQRVAITETPGIITSAYLAIRPREFVLPQFYCYLLKAMDSMKLFHGMGTGIRLTLSFDELKKQMTLFPPISEQQHIVSFLDKKTSQIDEYIATKEKEIEALKEWKKALIARVVTKGLNKNAKMKDSGNSWIGEVPEHWDIKRLGSAFTENRKLNADMRCTEAYKFNYGALVRKDEDVNPEGMVDTYSKYTVLEPNDIVINGLNLNYDFVSMRVARAYAEGIITSAYLAMTPRDGIVPNYYLYLFKAMDAMKLFHGMGTGIRLTLLFSEMKKHQILFPPIQEQQAIVDYIDKATTKADKMIVELAYHVEYMKEYKQRLIADVVTGKINVQP